MIDYKYADLFHDDSVTKQITIEYDTTVITNEDLFNQTLTLEENLCSESELRFGSCESSAIKFKVANIVAPMINKWITVKMCLNGHTDELFMMGRYKVVEDKLTADRQWREIMAYDALYDIINSSVINWYNTILPNKDSKVTMKQFRTSFAQNFGLEQKEETLANDEMTVEKTIEVGEGIEIDNETEQTSIIKESALSGLDVLTAICEINGCFGHIGRDGKLHYIYLPQEIQGLWPSNDLYPSDDLLPIEPKTSRVGGNGTYISADYENFITKAIDKLQIRQEENDIGVIYGTGNNCYIIQNNFLLYGKSSEELTLIAKNIFDKISGITYMPLIGCEAIGNPCLEAGDPIRISTKYELIETYILERTLKGIQALRDTYKSNGVERYGETVNSVHQSIIQLKGKSNVLTRTIEETKSTITDVEKGLQTQITQNAESITMEADRAKKKEEEIDGAVVRTEETLSSKIEQTADRITQSVDKKIDETKEYDNLSES